MTLARRLPMSKKTKKRGRNLMLVILGLLILRSCNPDISVAESLGLPLKSPKVQIEERWSGLREEQVFLKATISKSETQRFLAWAKAHPSKPVYWSFDPISSWPELPSGTKPGWPPAINRKSVTGSFYIEAAFHYHGAFIINNLNKTNDVLYLYAMDFVNEEDLQNPESS